MSDGKPNPGSEAALDMGCKCPVLDNGHGAGYMGQPGIFVITAGCPVHPLPERFDVVTPPRKRSRERASRR